MIQPRSRRKQQSGQGLLEYALTVLVVLFLFQVMDTQIRKGIAKLWKYLAQNVAAGCPVPSPGEGCQASIPDELR